MSYLHFRHSYLHRLPPLPPFVAKAQVRTTAAPYLHYCHAHLHTTPLPFRGGVGWIRPEDPVSLWQSVAPHVGQQVDIRHRGHSHIEGRIDRILLRPDGALEVHLDTGHFCIEPRSTT